jgi:hypothetical protein
MGVNAQDFDRLNDVQLSRPVFEILRQQTDPGSHIDLEGSTTAYIDIETVIDFDAIH